MEEDEPEAEDLDSNDENHPYNDYPDEDNSDRSSEGVIRDQYISDEDEDEEELYRKYLRRVKRK